MKSKKKVVITKNGPYLVLGNLLLEKEIIVSDREGYSVEWQKGERYQDKEEYTLCRCGHSKNKPYCDGAHTKIDFDGTETAGYEEYIAQAEKTEGSGIELTDNVELCALARFCHNKKGNVWELTENSADQECKKEAIKQACNCPAGRLVIWDKKTAKSIEPEFKPSISLIEDPEKNVSGPIWLKGGIDLESDNGQKYETRNRVTLCRCGKSKNKPFCDGYHIQKYF